MRRKNLTTNVIPVLSFFTGAGFLDIGFVQAGFQVVWTNECDPHFIKGYNHALSFLIGHECRITNTNPVEYIGPNQIIKEAFGKDRPKLFGIIGGPPCPDFSVGGKNKGQEGEHGKLSQVYIHRILELQPAFFLFENVPGFLRTAKHKEFFHHLLQQLKSDYLVDYQILNALDAGVPQDRERLFIVGIHKKRMRKSCLKEAVSDPEWFPWYRYMKYPGAKDHYPWPGTSPFGNEPEKPEGIPAELMAGTYINNTLETENLPNGRDYLLPRSAKLDQIPEGDVSRKSFKRLHRWRYSPTAAYGNNEVHLHPFEPRRLTVREALRLQSVPDSYALPRSMPLTKKYKTVGNGVPVKLAYAVAMSLQKIIKEWLL
ncbi:DNA cytosine methyltransferase [Paenibacillus ehimensis]|uniref:DNA cytosine methyltransferase n=1 Tax=Paenibacillus ehimensis TaxID=79264 RepID=UPI00056C26B4|nr:DNA cytosine methyltransferase [Paenibacillus ehimensis]